MDGEETLAPRALVAVALFLGLITGIGVAALYLGLTRLNHPSLARFPVQGIDVSHHQGDIDWTRLAGPRVRFAYIKASEGASFRDPRFAANWAGASAAGVVPGAYHFFTLCRSGVDQAEHFVGVLSQVRGRIMLPPAVDLEFGGNCAKRPTPEALRAELLAFSVVLEAQLGCRPIFYVTPDFHKAYVADRLEDAAIWKRSILRMPDGREGEDWLFWQFANRGRVKGIATFVDLDAFHGSASEFERIQCGRGDRAVPSTGSI